MIQRFWPKSHQDHFRQVKLCKLRVSHPGSFYLIFTRKSTQKFLWSIVYERIHSKPSWGAVFNTPNNDDNKMSTKNANTNRPLTKQTAIIVECGWA